MNTSIKAINPIPARDGAGVNLLRYIGTPYTGDIDPFLLFDCFYSDNPKDYIAGFPDHPHRGFETVTYIVKGSLKHADNKGHAGEILDGGVQWMTAGKGIIHSEMPIQKDGLLYGFQVWINLPSNEKLCEPRYQEFSHEDFSIDETQQGIKVKVIAGKSNQYKGLIETKLNDTSFFDISVNQNEHYSASSLNGNTTLLFVIEGQIEVENFEVKENQLVQLSTSALNVLAQKDSRFLLFSAPSIKEPIARSGPFVMNTQEEIYQAIMDYQAGNF